MTDSFWKTGAPGPRQERLAWPSPIQLVRQFAIVAVVVVLWGFLFVGYLRLTDRRAEGPLSDQPDPVAVVTPPTETPTLQPEDTTTPTTAIATTPTTAATSTPAPTATPSVADTPSTPTPTARPETTVVETPSPDPEPTATPTDTPAPSPTPTETPVLPTDTPVPPEETSGVSFAGDVLPIFERRCVKCHGGDKTEEGLVLKSYADAMTGSWNGPVIEPGSAEGSFLVEQIVTGEMPKKEPRLLPSEIRAISDWIDAGAPDN